MDGRGNLRNDAPWGWPASTWQAWTLLLTGALVLSNAAWYYRGQAAAVERSTDPRPAPQHVAMPAALVESEDERSARLEQLRVARAEARARAQPLQEGERCISGQRFARIRGVLTNIGLCQ